MGRAIYTGKIDDNVESRKMGFDTSQAETLRPSGNSKLDTAAFIGSGDLEIEAALSTISLPSRRGSPQRRAVHSNPGAPHQ